jgi:hypothetical protein
MILVLLFAAWLRLRYLVEFVEWPDEIRTLWRSTTTFENLLTRTPADWPPSYGILMWGWARLAGGTLEASRVLSALFGVLGVALVYRAAGAVYMLTAVGAQHAVPLQRRNIHLAGVLAALVYAVAGYSIFAGVDVRAYGLLMALGALALWLNARWLARPTWRSGLIAALVLALPVYVSYTSVAFVALVGGLALVMRPRLFPRWLLVAAGAGVLALPLVPGFLTNAANRVGGVMEQPVPPFFEAMFGVYRDFGGSTAFVIALVAAALVAFALAWQGRGRRLVLVLAAWSLFPVAVYVLLNNNEFLKPRYMWWVLLGLAPLVGYAVVHVPRPLSWSTLAAAALLAFAPVDYNAYRLAETTAPPFRATFRWFAERLRPGDVLVIDPNCTCGEAYGWDVFVPQFFPSGRLPIVERPGDAARVWYLSTTGWERDEALVREVETGRAESVFSGPWFFLLRLYEAPPLSEGVGFGGQMRLHGVELSDANAIMGKNERFTVRLWWSADAPLPRDYSISLALLDWRGQLVAQADGPALAEGTPQATSGWQPGTIYNDYRMLQLPADAEDGEYRLVAAVYYWEDGQRLAPEANPYFETTDDSYLILERIRVTS